MVHTGNFRYFAIMKFPGKNPQEFLFSAYSSDRQAPIKPNSSQTVLLYRNVFFFRTSVEKNLSNISRHSFQYRLNSHCGITVGRTATLTVCINNIQTENQQYKFVATGLDLPGNIVS